MAGWKLAPLLIPMNPSGNVHGACHCSTFIPEQKETLQNENQSYKKRLKKWKSIGKDRRYGEKTSNREENKGCQFDLQ